ncbi:YIPF5 protein, partial [Polyodon spathula]|nr:YIPF5 protein [Polyodon spathula]
EMSGFDSLNPDFYQTSYSIDDQAQGTYDSNNAGDPYSNKQQYGNYNYPLQGGHSTPGVMQLQQPYTGQIYQPTFTPTAPQSVYGSSFEDEPPLLEAVNQLAEERADLVSECVSNENLNDMQSNEGVVLK